MRILKKVAACLLVVVMTVSAAGCGSEKKETGKGTTGTIKIATKPMTEQYILGEMLKQLIENKTDYKVEVTKGIGGGTSNIHPAMEKGEFDLYPEYTSSGWGMVLGNQAGEVSDDEILEKLQKEYQEKFQMTWLGLYGFNNTYALAVSKKVADKYQLKNCSDLAKVSKDLVFGGNPDYIEREDGFPGVCKAYGLEFKNVKDIDIGLKYKAMENDDIQVTNGFTTDAQISKDNIVVLEDDKGYQVNYFCSTVVREETLEKYPDLEKTLMLMNGILSDQEMAELNYQVEIDGKDEAVVAKDFLIKKGLIEE